MSCLFNLKCGSKMPYIDKRARSKLKEDCCMVQCRQGVDVLYLLCSLVQQRAEAQHPPLKQDNIHLAFHLLPSTLRCSVASATVA